MLVALIDGFSAHRYQIGVEGERGAKEADQQKMEPSRAILIDLSPAATFIAAMTNAIGRIVPRLDEIEQIVLEIGRTEASLLETRVTTHVRPPALGIAA